MHQVNNHKARLVIVAAGLGSRLAPLTNSIPKFLINIGKNTGYVEMIRYWQTQVDLEDYPLTVIIHSKYSNLVNEYHNLYFPDIKLIIKEVDVANGSAHAIMTSCHHLNGEAVTFSWCDVIAKDSLPADYDADNCVNTIFTNYNNSNRYDLKATYGPYVVPVIDENERGGCFGLYHIGNFDTTKATFVDGQDFIEIIPQFGKIIECELDKIIDFGDMPKLKHTRASADKAREFNSVEMIGDYVLKKATNDQGKGLIQRELAWYKQLTELVEIKEVERPAVPQTWIASDNASFFMTRAKGVPICEAWADLSPKNRRHVLSQLIEQRQAIFNLGACKASSLDLGILNIIRNDIKKEAQDKLISRYIEMRGVINSFGSIDTVNGYQLKEFDPVVTIKRLGETIANYYSDKENINYGFIHGDLTLSNSMVDLDTLKVSILDPRGFFGNTNFYGIGDYDNGKLLYALSGYGEFNNSRSFHIKKLEDGKIEFEIPELIKDGIEDIMEEFSPIHYLWKIVCWQGLSQYIKCDPVKSICAHYHGVAMAEQYLDLFSK